LFVLAETKIYIYRSLCGLRREEEEEVTQGTPI
jgi:hypothetical protein